MNTSFCKACGVKIGWIKLISTEFNPVDLPGKNRITEEGLIIKVYQSHYETCEFADQFRKVKQKPPPINKQQSFFED